MNLLKQIRLPNGRNALNVGFGCVGLLRIPLPFQRTRLLRAAVGLGITHFDVARMYGLGAAEGVIGQALKPLRNRVTLATKFGIPRGVPNPLVVNLKYGARWLLSLRPGAVQRYKQNAAASAPAGRHVDFSLAELERSLATSLQQLQTDCIDLLFLHEPRQGDNLPDALGQALRQKVNEGKVGAFGVSGYPHDVAYFLQQRPEVCGDAIQYNYSILNEDDEAPPRQSFTGMFRVLDGTLSPLAKVLFQEPDLAKTWSHHLDLDLTHTENLGIVILATTLALNPDGMVIFSTTHPGRLRRIVEKLNTNSFTLEALLEFRTAVSTRLAPHHAK